MMNTEKGILFNSLKFGGFEVSNRIAMAPMTRSRAAEGDVPTDLMAEYYEQRAGAGLIITEGAPISEEARGYSFTPGIYTQEQIEGWKKVTQKVHDKGGRIFIQLWHVGRRSHSLISGTQPVAPSAIKIPDQVWGPLGDGNYGRIETEAPRAMSIEDIKNCIQDFVNAAKNAVEAGFDGVELHGAHGYLIDQFLRVHSNERLDDYGGSQKNRMRFLLEVVAAVAQEIGADKTAIRISPFVSEGAVGDHDPEIIELTYKMLAELQEMNLAYVHFSENISNHKEVTEEFRKSVREIYSNPIMVCGKFTKETGTEILENGYADLVAYGQPYISNPDLVERFRNDSPLTELRADSNATFYGGGAKGFTDYPTFAEMQNK